jgi:cystathionine beta-synthase
MGRPYLVEGVGEDFWPTAYDPSVVDEIVEVSDQAAFEMTRRMAQEEGLLVGGSCGLAVVAGLKVARKAKAGDLVVILLPDSGRGYLGKIFNDDWMQKYGFSKSDGDNLIGSVLAKKSKDLPDLIHTHPSEAIGDVIEILREFGVTQIPVFKTEPPVMAAEIVGSVSESALLEAIFTGKAKLTDPISAVQSAPLPMIGSGETISVGVEALRQSETLLVLEGGKPIGVITRQDLLGSVK